MSRTLQAVLNEANPNKLDPAFQKVVVGDALALIPRIFSGAVTSDTLVLPTNAKAIAILSAYATAAGTPGYRTPVAQLTALAATTCKVSPTGDILFSAGTAVTAAEVVYMSAEGQVITETVDVVASVGTLNFNRSATTLLSANVLVGATLGPIPTIVLRGTAAPSATECALSDVGNTIAFNAADVVTGSVSVSYIAFPGSGTSSQDSLADLLASQVDF